MTRKWWFEKSNLGYAVIKFYPPVRKETVLRPEPLQHPPGVGKLREKIELLKKAWRL